MIKESSSTTGPRRPASPVQDQPPNIPAPSDPPKVNTTPTQLLPPQAYDPPADLPEIEEEARCETDVQIILLEPEVAGPLADRMRGSGWCGVKEIEVTLSGGGRYFTETTATDGSVRFSAVPCGAYTISLTQDQFNIESLDQLAMTVTSTRKSGREKEIKIRRQLMTVEMFRLPTLMTSALLEYFDLGTRPASVPRDQDIWGHHWIKIYNTEDDADDEIPNDSYGWWPLADAPHPPGYPIQSVKGALNGYRSASEKYPGGSPTTDPYHTKYKRSNPALEDVFFPWVTNGFSADEYKNMIRSKANGFSSSVSDRWSWRTDRAGWHCKTFQAYIMRETKDWKRLGVGIGNWGWSTNV